MHFLVGRSLAVLTLVCRPRIDSSSVRFRPRAFVSRHPIAYVSRAVSQLCSFCLHSRQKPDCIATYQGDFCQIYRQDAFCPFFFLDQFAQNLDIGAVDASAYVQDHKSIRSDNSLKFAGHKRRAA